MGFFCGRVKAAATVLTVLLPLVAGTSSQAQTAARFDLAGPRVDVRVTRNGKTLPIASVPNLQPGDKLWLMADLPRTQSVHYLLVTVFLRGTTNPPPDTWFTKIETWNKKVRAEGATVTVPDEAQQALIFLAPETGGDFSTLRSAVQGRPGIFVRASQDLSEAGFEQQRIEKYLASISQVPPGDPKALQDHSAFLARTLSLKPNQDCFNKTADQQYLCLTQTGTQMLLDDGHGQTVASMLSSNDTSALISAASYTSLGGGGLYSAYVGAIVDLVRLTSNLHTAQYQYIPAIAFPQNEEMNLRLNTAPSFHNPKSVIVIGLPSVQKAVPPPLRASDSQHITCLMQPSVVLPVEGAPLVFSTGFAHDLFLHVTGGTPRPDIPLVADAFKGGLVVAQESDRKLLQTPSVEPPPADKNSGDRQGESRAPTDPSAPHTPVSGTVIGYWGFEPFTGPTLPLQDFPGEGWKLSTDGVLIAGRDNHLRLTSNGTACIDRISLEHRDGRQVDVQWKQTDRASIVDVTLPLKSVDPGAIHIDVRQFGGTPVAAVTAQTFSEPAHIASIKLHAGDNIAVIEGKSLDQVKQLVLNNLVFAPSGEPGGGGASENLSLALPDTAAAAKLNAGEQLTAHVGLRDGRTLSVPITISASRPTVTLLNKNIGKGGNTPIKLANPDDLPINQQMTFSLRSPIPFPRDAKIEIASPDNSLKTTLSVSSGSLILQNSRTLLATLDPLKSFGPSAFGPIRLRAIAPDGTTGDWIALATLVRLPTIDSVHCPSDPTAPCTLMGSNLYLIDELSNDQAFTSPVDVPDGFVGDTLNLPRPPKSGFFLKLRDEPESANMVAVTPKIEHGSAPPAPIPSATAPSTTPPPASTEPAPAPTDPAASTQPTQPTPPQSR